MVSDNMNLEIRVFSVHLYPVKLTLISLSQVLLLTCFFPVSFNLITTLNPDFM